MKHNPENILTEFNSGGKHYENILGGIPQGMNSKGTMNTVEEGETKVGNYVFSDRFKITPEDVQKYSLPKNYKNKTISQASKLANKMAEESNSKIDKDTSKDLLSRLKVVNDYKKQEQDISQGMPQKSLPQEQFSPGGFMSLAGANAVNPMPEANMAGGKDSVSGALSAVTTAMEFGDDLFGKTDVLADGSQSYEKVSEVGSTIGGAAKGASAGMSVGGPIGAAVGGGIGLISGLIGSKRKNKDIARANDEFLLTQNARMRESDFADGTEMDIVDPNKRSNGREELEIDYTKTPNPLIDYSAIDFDLSQPNIYQP